MVIRMVRTRLWGEIEGVSGTAPEHCTDLLPEHTLSSRRDEGPVDRKYAIVMQFLMFDPNC